MNHNPSDSIYPGILEQSIVATEIAQWFDEIHVCKLDKNINKVLYHLISFERCDDKYLDFFLYDKGFSTHKDLSANAKRDILRNWQDIYNYRLSFQGLKAYLDAVTQGSVTITPTINPKSKFIQTNSSRFGFPSQDSIDSYGTPYDFMTYLYSPEYEVTDTLDITLEVRNAYTDLMTDYIFELLRYELPKSNSDHKVEVNLYDPSGPTLIKTKTL